jgi:uncharacterized protein
MLLSVNLRHLENRNVVLRGELASAELDLDARDEMIRVVSPVHFDIEIEKLEEAILAQGELRIGLECECVRCLKKFKRDLVLEDWTLLLPLEGDEKVPVNDDCVDLTPFMREDILLEFPQHPLCEPDCGGLKKIARKSGAEKESKPEVWAELNKLKL